MERKHFTAAERGALNYLAALPDLAISIEPLKRRIESIPNGKQMMGAVKGMSIKLMEGVMDTMPDNELMMFRRNLNALTIDVGMRNKCKNGNKINGVWLSIEDLNVMASASRAYCLTCDRDVQEQRQCPLAKLLDALSVPDADEQARGCKYFVL